MIIIHCPKCEKRLAFKDEQAGKNAKCSGCGLIFLIKPPVPAPSTSVTSTAATNLAVSAGNNRSPVFKSSPSQTPVLPRLSTPCKLIVDAEVVEDERIGVSCECGRVIRTPKTAQGKAVRCKDCSQVTPVPTLELVPAIDYETYNARGGESATPLLIDEKRPLKQNVHSASPPETSFASNPLWSEIEAQQSNSYSQPIASNTYDSIPSSYSVQSNRKRKSEFWSNLVAGDLRFTIFMFMMIVGGPIMTCFGIYKAMEYGKIASEGKIAVGTIVSCSEHFSRRGGRSYSINVAYVADNGTSYQSNFSVSSSVYEARVSDGQIVHPNIEVKYLPSSPTSCYLAEDEPFQWGVFILGLCMCVAGFGVAFYRIQEGS